MAALIHLWRLMRMREAVFSMPLAYSGMLLAASGLPPFHVWLWVTLAVLAARSVGMSLNRVVDASIDAANERTRHRLVPSGAVSRRFVLGATVGFAAVFLFSAWMLNPLCFALAFPILACLGAYSFFKRFSATSHLFLGFTEAFAPIGGYLAAAGYFSPEVLPLAFFVLFWIAGLDVIYSCQDFDHDRRAGLHSIPVRFGLKTALHVSSLFHALAVLSLGVLGGMLEAGALYWLGVFCILLLFIHQHRLVAPHDLRQVHRAFFAVNRLIALSLLLTFFLHRVSF